MRLRASVMLAFCLLAAGCVAGESKPAVPPVAPGSGVPSLAATAADVPADDPTQFRIDEAGRTPDEAVLALRAAIDAHDWEAAYALYTTPNVEFDAAAAQWEAAEERYESFEVLETRVVDADRAWVRVAFRGVTGTSEGTYAVDVPAPGEWWPVERAGGLWKTKWMPRQ